jgi:hypothetical protein
VIDRLFVLWSDPDRGRRHLIGHLERRAGVFRFWYDAELATAERKGFSRLPAFPDARGETAPYEARYLFASFAERIPARARPDAADMLAEWGVEHRDDQLEVLARSGGIRATDRLELAEYRAADDELAKPLEFRLAGTTHVEGAQLRVGEHLELHREPHNEADPCATIVVTIGGQRAGYVPRQYSAMVSRLLDRGDRIDASAVRPLMLPDDAGKWVIRVSRGNDSRR